MEPIGIYLHYPFCLSLCPYCDFNSFIKDETNENDIIDSYISELEYYKNNILINNRIIKSIYFGGGTPSLMMPKNIEKIINYIYKNFTVENKIEITCEANPTSIENQKLKNFKLAGINRISIGIQALNDVDLKFLGRKHSAKEAIEAINLASNIFDEFSFDLIYARNNNHKLDDWKKELKQAISIAGNHLSLYSLAIEKGTDFFTQNAKGLFPIITNDKSEEMYFETLNIMENNGFERYEISNFAKNNKQSKHNMLYWKIYDYLGIGPGSHGRVFYKNNIRMQTMTQHKPAKWIESVKNNIGLQTEELISVNEQVNEILMMGLRISDGIDLSDIKERFNINLIDLLNQDLLNKYISDNLLILENNYLKPTKIGINLIGNIVKKLYLTV